MSSRACQPEQNDRTLGYAHTDGATAHVESSSRNWFGNDDDIFKPQSDAPPLERHTLEVACHVPLGPTWGAARHRASGHLDFGI